MLKSTNFPQLWKSWLFVYVQLHSPHCGFHQICSMEWTVDEWLVSSHNHSTGHFWYQQFAFGTARPCPRIGSRHLVWVQRMPDKRRTLSRKFFCSPTAAEVKRADARTDAKILPDRTAELSCFSRHSRRPGSAIPATLVIGRRRKTPHHCDTLTQTHRFSRRYVTDVCLEA